MFRVYFGFLYVYEHSMKLCLFNTSVYYGYVTCTYSYMYSMERYEEIDYISKWTFNILIIRKLTIIALYLLIIIIIIMSRRLRGYPWPSLAISPYHSSPPAGLQGYIPCPHIAGVCKFVLVVPLLHIHEWGSTGVHRLWARSCFSSSVLRVWFVELV